MHVNYTPCSTRSPLTIASSLVLPLSLSHTEINNFCLHAVWVSSVCVVVVAVVVAAAEHNLILMHVGNASVEKIEIQISLELPKLGKKRVENENLNARHTFCNRCRSCRRCRRRCASSDCCSLARTRPAT